MRVRRQGHAAPGQGAGFATQRLLTKRATADAVLDALGEAADELRKGDQLFVTYSGHGGQVPDITDDEQDRMDETWVCFDRQVVDDELYRAVGSVPRRACASSCCPTAATAARPRADILRLVKPSALRGALDVDPGTGMKAMPAELVPKVYNAHRDTLRRRAEGLARSVRTSTWPRTSC